MKKLLALLLASALCVSLTACGNNKYDPLIELLEKGDYDEAVNYIKDLQSEDNDTSTKGADAQQGIVIGTDQGNSEQDEAAEKAMLTLLMGQWDWTHDPEEGLPQKWIFNEDGTCYADDVQLQWKSDGLVSYSYSLGSANSANSAKELRITIYTGNETKYTGLLKQKENGEVGLSCNTGDFIVLSSPFYIKPEQYEIIQLTADNWQTYLEQTKTPYCEYNSFGDISIMGTNHRLVLKEEFFSRLSAYASSDCAAEVSYTVYRCDDVTVDFENGTYTLGTTPYDRGTGETCIRDFYKHDDYFGVNYADEWVSNIYTPPEATNGRYCTVPTHFNMLRVQGTLYLLKNN